MRMARLGLWSVAAWVAACGGEPPPPEAAKYFVRGSVTGLSGEVTLQLNGQERLTRTADGPFAFETSLANQAAYAVTVATQPAEQDCAVEGGTGQVAGTDGGPVQVRCTSRTYPIGGSVEGARGSLALTLGTETLPLSVEGRFTFVTRLPRGSTYAVGLSNTPPGLRCTVSNGSGSVAGAVEDISVRCHDWYTLTPHQSASGVLGQGDFTSRTAERGGTTGAGTLNRPVGNPAFVAGQLYVTDQGSNRVLGFAGVPGTLGADAQWVLGQADFSGYDSGTGLQGLGQPTGLGGDSTRLAVADQRNSRVLVYAPLPSATATAPTLVLGQPDFDTATFGCAANALSYPQDVFVGRGRLLVADSANHRVLVWNAPPTTNGQPADVVLGQGTFDTCRRNDANGDGTPDSKPGPTTLFNPTGVWTDGQRLAVVDSYNNRVLLWNTFPTTNGQPADVVLGQKDFTSNAAALSATGVDNPATVTSTGEQLFVTDTLNHRVLVWNAFPTASATPPDLVLGQADFTRADRYDPPMGTAPSARSLVEPGGITLAWPYVVVSDYGNNRALLFQSQ